MDKVFICSPYRDNPEENLKKAITYCKMADIYCMLPIAPHVYFTRVFPEESWRARFIGRSWGKDLMQYCTEIWIFCDELTEGMIEEIAQAKKLGLKMKFFNTESFFIQICDPDDMEPVFDLAKARGLYILQTDNGDSNSYAISSEKYEGSSWWDPSFPSDYVTLHYSNVSDVSGHRFVYHFADGKGEIEYSSSRGIEGGRYSNAKNALKEYMDR